MLTFLEVRRKRVPYLDVVSCCVGQDLPTQWLLMPQLT
jgi:hypothetical protein